MSITNFSRDNKFQISNGGRVFLILILFTLFFICNPTSCTFLNEEDLYDDIQCDTIDVSYDNLTYIFTGICSKCHNGVFTYREGIMMDSYKNVKSSIATGRVLPAINHAEGFRPMPNGMPKLSDCDLNKIKAWINSGMPEK